MSKEKETSSISSSSDSSFDSAFDRAEASQPPPSTHKKEPETKWYRKLGGGKEPEQPGKEKWRDASLSDKERWKEWQKSMDKQQHEGSAAGVFARHYKSKGSWGYWLGGFT